MNRPNADDSQPQAPREERAQAHSGRHPEGGYRPDSSAAARRPIELDRLREVGRNLGNQIDEQVRKRPYAVLGAAAGFGFVAGSILGSRLGQMLLAAGVGYAAKRVLGGDFGIERLQAELEKLTGEAERRTGRT
ncbi:MAG TPA: hypothetical protein VK762_38405 [Polyangiaceae bacterium]|jgi:hypothetical protein|nr:hypothetical protein [Polyangiaceae bacterium]